MTWELDAARRAEMAMPATRAVALVSKAMPNVWKAIDDLRAARTSELFLNWDEATDIAIGKACGDDYARWSFSDEGRSFVHPGDENSRGYRMGKLILATAGWRSAQAVFPLSVETLRSLREIDVSDMTASLLTGLPHRSIYIPMRTLTDDAAGVFAYYDKQQSPAAEMMVLDLLVINSLGIPVFNYSIPIPSHGENTVTASAINDLANKAFSYEYEFPDADNQITQLMMMPLPSREEFEAKVLPEIYLMLNAVFHIISQRED